MATILSIELNHVTGGIITRTSRPGRRSKAMAQGITDYESHKCSIDTNKNDYVMARM